MCNSCVTQGVGRRYANLICKKADVDMNKRAGELEDDEVSISNRAHHSIITLLLRLKGL